MTRFQFVADHRDAFEVKRLCEIVDVARSSFYAWLAAAPARAARAGHDAALAKLIRTIHDTDTCGCREPCHVMTCTYRGRSISGLLVVGVMVAVRVR